MSYASDALLKETAAKVSAIEKRLAELSAPKDLSDDIRRLDGEIKALKMRMGKQKE